VRGALRSAKATNSATTPWGQLVSALALLALQDRVPEVAIPWWDWTSAAAHQDGSAARRG
jgi:hypothetical protein